MSDQDVHVVPLSDLLEHCTTSSECMCDPSVELVGASLVVIHNAYDGREGGEAKETAHATPE